MGELAGVRVLVVEDHALLAMALCDRLQDRGVHVVGPAARLAEAQALAEEPQFDIAILDVHLGGEQSYPLARALRERGIPIIFMTGYDYWALPPDLRDLPMFDKLGLPADLEDMIERALRPTP